MAAPASPLPPDRRAPSGKPDDPDSVEDPSSGIDVGEYLSIAGGDADIEFEDAADGRGGSFALLDQAKESDPGEEEGGFYENLALVLPDSIMQDVVTDLLRKVEEDKKSREARDKQYEEGIRRTGLGKDAPGGAEFEGASRVVHPMLTEACVDYESRVIKELMPPSGPAKEKIVGVVTEEKTERAKRKVEHMNWQITTQITEAFSVMETTLTQVPLGGSQFIKQWWDHRLMRPRWQFVPIDKVYLPFSAESFHSSHRRTFVDTVTAVEYQQRIESKQYRDLNLPPPSQMPEPSKAEKANEKVEGAEDPGLNIDAEREIYEVMSYIEITGKMGETLTHEEKGKLYPYLISIDVTSKKALSWYRDWEEDDDTREPIEHLFEFPFIPWRGAYSIGFPQIIGGLSGAATGALRALLDSAHINNAATFLLLKGSGAGGQTRRANIGEGTEIDMGLETDDIRKRVMPMPFNPPSPILFQLLGFVGDAAKGVVRTSLDETAIDSNANVPVGTQLSRVEEGLVVFSSIHGRIHKAFNRLLVGLHRLNKLYLPDSVRVDAKGTEILVNRADYEGPCDVQPVSDPTIYSDLQRQGQDTALLQLVPMFPGVLKPRAILERIMKRLKIPEYETLLVDEPTPTELNQVNECLQMSLGMPAKVFPTQNHLAHLAVLLDFMKSPVLGMNPLIAPKFLPLALQHAAEHVVMYYVQHTVDTVKGAANGRDPHELMSNDVKVKSALDELLAQASQKVVPEVESAVAGAVPVIQQAMQMLQQLAPKPQLDPAVQAATQAAMAETTRKGAADQGNIQIKTAELTTQQQNNEAKNQLDEQRNAIMSQRNDVALQNADTAARARIAQTNLDNATARDIATDRLTEGASPGYRNGQSLSE